MLANNNVVEPSFEKLELAKFIKQEIVKLRDDITSAKLVIAKLENRMEKLESAEQLIPEEPVQPFVNLSLFKSESPAPMIGPVGTVCKPLGPDSLKSDSSTTPTQNPDPPVTNECEVNAFFEDNPGQFSTGDSDESDVIQLKRKLYNQLRAAEVEMSLERARVFQQRAELEEMKIQLQQEQSAVNQTTGQHPNELIESRWDRHLDYFRKKA